MDDDDDIIRNRDNRGRNQRNRGNRGSGNRGNPANRGNRQVGRGNGNHNHRGGNHDHRQRQRDGPSGINRNRYGSHSRASTPSEIDWFEQRPVHHRSLQNLPTFNPNDVRRDDYGGRYGSTSQSNNNERPDNNRGRGKPRFRTPHMGFQKLEALTQMEPDQLVVTLSNQDVGLDKLIQTDLSPDYIVLILRVISQLCASKFQENKGRTLATLCQKHFTDQLNHYLSDLILQDARDKQRNKFFWNEKDRFWNDILIFYENILVLIPHTACEVLPKLIARTCMAIRDMENGQHVAVPEDIKEKFEELQIKLHKCVDERERRKEKNAHSSMNDQEPPNNFRTISLYPTVDEITSREKPFLRENIIDGSYKDVEQYLDVQFRLLREDFVAPLREGICEYIAQQSSKERKRIFNVRIYKNVQFVKKHTVQDRVSLIVQFAAMGQKKKTFENSRRFMFGSLLCFTENSFRTVVFGTVSQRDPELLAQGQIAVDILEDVSYDKFYIMVECSVYFEPYHHVLKALQMMDEEKFPLKRYIVDVVPDVNPPSYLGHITTITYNEFKFCPLLDYEWPSENQLGLDNSQYQAFKSALTKEFCVIQGPPGTGKTYIGLKISEVLLQNKSLWNAEKGPILVICFTNHALDQFLEGLLKYTSKLVRIGGQSKSPDLKKHNIREMRIKGRRDRDSSELMWRKRIEIRNCLSDIQKHQKLLDSIFACNKVFNFSHFDAVDQDLHKSWFKKAKNEDIIEWLLGGRTSDDRYNERRRKRMAEAQAAQADNEDDKANLSDSGDEFFDAETEENREIDDVDDILINIDSLHHHNLILYSKTDLQNNISRLELEINTLAQEAEEENNFSVYDEKGIKEAELDKTIDHLDYFNYRMEQYRNNNYSARPRIVNYQNPQQLTPNERWGLYFSWLDLLKRQLDEALTVLDTRYRKLYREYEEVKQIEDVQLMREMDVVGMTTTGAARFQTLLQALKCPIVIVEEAAEVLETHVVVALTNDCKHLILIGDHKQLRPTTAEYRLAKHFNLEISLFERMVKNGIHCEQLEVQHRMRPQIAQLIVPAIYPKLENHVSVESYPRVYGIDKNVFFITHTEPEEMVGDSGSRQNVHEARFLIKLARHLILQGYDPSDITILATYSGQMFCMWKERKQYPQLKDVRITVVDNFQGEENKIILLSLVRSNAESNIGFLRTDNRVCVALSRAKEGLYIMGNMNILEKSDNVWPKIKQVLDSYNGINTYLTLECQVHSDQLTSVRTADDFLKVPEGGCTRMCDKQLDCGHICLSLCHVTDREHIQYACKEKCNKIICDLAHQCPDLCYKRCKPCKVKLPITLKCEHNHMIDCHMSKTIELFECPTLVEVELKCGHKANKPCHKDIEKFACPHLCEIRKPCGHACDRHCHVNDDPDHLKGKCFKPCGKFRKDCSLNEHVCPNKCYEDCAPCTMKVEKKRSCGHMDKAIECQVNIEERECTKPCRKTLKCGHKCSSTCSKICGDCSVIIDKVVPDCGHKIKEKCSVPADKSKCNGKCPRLLPCGHICTKKCKEDCSIRCEHLVPNPHPAACGHQFLIPCYKVSRDLKPSDYKLLKHCDKPCDTLLDCKHTCAGTCGKCAQGRVHMSCQEQCGAPLICGHPCEIPCREACQPCNKICTYKCTHSKCGKKCGEPCAPCRERCERRCPHGRCTKMCSQPCSKPPCTEPCLVLLRCTHPCLGYCGEPCPPICRECNPENEAFEVYFGDEDEPDARFVVLKECGHSFVGDSLDQWFGEVVEKGREINVKRCPRCNTIITSTQRYSDYIKAAYEDVVKVKKLQFGEPDKNEEQRVLLQMKISQVSKMNLSLYLNSKHLRDILKDLQNTLQSTTKNDRRNPIHIMIANRIETEANFLEQLANIYNKATFQKDEQINQKCLGYFDFILSFLQNQKCRFTKQETADLFLEAKRFDKIINLLNAEHHTKFRVALQKDAVKRIHENICQNLFAADKYSDQTDIKIRENLRTLCELIDKTLKIEESELKMVAKAMRMGVGHWYKCPNGHLYVIGDCGGAVTTSKCNECGAGIGGLGYAPLTNNVRTNIGSFI